MSDLSSWWWTWLQFTVTSSGWWCLWLSISLRPWWWRCSYFCLQTSVSSQARNSCISYQILIRDETQLTFLTSLSPLHRRECEFLLMDSDQIETWDLGLEIDDLWHCQPEVCCLSITEEGICKELGDEWPGRGDKTRQAFRALLNSELPLAIPTWSSVNLINTAWTGRTPSSREKSRAPMIFKLKTSRQHRGLTLYYLL